MNGNMSRRRFLLSSAGSAVCLGGRLGQETSAVGDLGNVVGHCADASQRRVRRDQRRDGVQPSSVAMAWNPLATHYPEKRGALTGRAGTGVHGLVQDAIGLLKV